MIWTIPCVKHGIERHQIPRPADVKSVSVHRFMGIVIRVMVDRDNFTR